MLSLPVNAMSTARLIVEPAADGLPQGVPVGRGGIERGADRSIMGRIGPSDRIVVRWTKPGRADTPRHTGPVEGLLLWDVTPAGDRLRARLTYRRAEEIPAVRLAHDAGLALRSVEAPGATRVYCEEDAENGQWLLSFDPPLPPTVTLSVECWLPLPDDPPRAPEGPPATTDRHLPAIHPVGAERFTGIVGVRRPGDWTGRLGPAPDAELLNDEVFVKAWGSLPEEPLTLCGTRGFNGDLGAALQTGPAPPRIVIHPAEQIRVESGRIVVAVDADIHEVSGHSPIMEAELPAGMQLTQVAGEGLLDWTLSADRRLHLTWQHRGPVPREHLRIVGWIPLNEDPLKTGNRQHRVRTPWIGWPGADVGPGTLTIFSGTRTTLDGGTGLLPAATNAAAEPSIGVGVGGAVIATGEGAGASAPARLSYQVNDPSRLGELSWDSRPPRVAVVVESQLTIHSDFAQWVAVVRYDVAGGSLDEINLRIPSAWAEGAEAAPLGRRSPNDGPRRRLIGLLEGRARASPLGIAPVRAPLDPPPGGRSRYRLSRGRAPGLGGRGRLPRHRERDRPPAGLARCHRPASRSPTPPTSATGSSAATPGRRPAPSTSRRRCGPCASQLPRNGTEPAGSRDDAARVALADVLLTVLPDRSIVGRALYEVQPESGRLLTFELPPGSTILWSAVEPDPAVPFQSGRGVWSIVLDNARQDRICVVWKTPPTGSEPATTTPAPDPGAWPLALPRAGLGSCPTLVTVSTPPGLAMEGIPSGFEPATMARLDKARADWLGQSIRDAVAKVDRSSGRDHERLVALLINHELALRAADKAARWDGSGSPGTSTDRDLIESAVRSAGLTDDLTAAQGYLGLGPAAADRPSGGIPEPIAPCRIRAFGRPAAMLGFIKGIDETSTRPVLHFAGRLQGSFHEGGAARSALMVAALLGVAILATSFVGRRLAAAAALLVTLAVAGLAGGPASLAGGLGLAALAWSNGRAEERSSGSSAVPSRLASSRGGQCLHPSGSTSDSASCGERRPS